MGSLELSPTWIFVKSQCCPTRVLLRAAGVFIYLLPSALAKISTQLMCQLPVLQASPTDSLALQGNSIWAESQILVIGYHQCARRDECPGNTGGTPAVSVTMSIAGC